MIEEAVLLKRGKPVRYQRCNCCDHYSRGLSPRGWCGACELEFATVRQREPKPRGQGA